MLLLVFIIFLYGLVFGSFFGVLITRTELGQSYTGRSACPHCKRQILWYENLPLISYLILGGKCSGCGEKISIFYPIVEITTGILFGVTAFHYFYSLGIKGYDISLSISNIITLILALIVLSLFYVIAIYDARTYEIPNRFSLTLAFLTVIFVVTLYHNLPDFSQIIVIRLLTGLIAGLLFFLPAFLTKEKWMGGGDFKLVFSMGFLLGPYRFLLAIIIASLTGSFVGIILIKKKKKKLFSQTEIPFGPFLVLGTFVAFFLGGIIINYYVRIIIGI